MTGQQVNVLIDKNHNTRLMRAARDGDIEGMLRFLSEGDDINQRSKSGKTALMVAADNGQFEAAKLLVKNHADINMQGGPNNQTALMYAIDGGHLPLVEELVRLKVDLSPLSESGHTALQMAILRCHSYIALAIIDGDATLAGNSAYSDALINMAEKRYLYDVAKRISEKIDEDRANAWTLRGAGEARHSKQIESAKETLRGIDEEMGDAIRESKKGAKG